MSSISLLLDTHIIWWLGYQPQKLSDASREAIRAASLNRDRIALSAASLYELAWLIRQGRLIADVAPENFLEEIKRRFVILPIDGNIAERAALLANPFHGDPMDRIIVTTAIETGRQLVTADRAILTANLCATCW
ncbi:type II toxin-antitoxin system VapC family toxin [Acidicapsa dinghuensis]|uniref:Type II toxin-antitoxin system VapC family toxin n=1 Tax=Acidicapsa dinghuensis TaxID=2218256 RepID=A0ABW1E9C6_9BACT|nr:type II toxin-antitoxin system VapC family toxin [Acidicapsa dinghuensis]